MLLLQPPPFFSQYLVSNCVEHCIVPLRTHEGTKTISLLMEALQAMDDFKLNRRRDLVIAIGGGVCLDVCGMAAALYRRGTPIVKVQRNVSHKGCGSITPLLSRYPRR